MKIWKINLFYIPTRGFGSLLMIAVALGILIPVYAICKETTLISGIILGLAALGIAAIGIALPKKRILIKWALYEAAVFISVVPAWDYLAKNSYRFGLWSIVLMLFVVIVAALIIMGTKFGFKKYR